MESIIIEGVRKFLEQQGYQLESISIRNDKADFSYINYEDYEEFKKNKSEGKVNEKNSGN